LSGTERATLRNFGLKVGTVGAVKFEARIKELVENLPDLAVLVEPLLIVRRVVREQIGILHRRLLAIVRDDDICWRLMTIPGVGPVVALDSVRARLHKILAEARAAQKLPWDPARVSLYRTIFPQMTNWLPEDEGAQLRFEFEAEMVRLKAA